MAWIVYLRLKLQLVTPPPAIPDVSDLTSVHSSKSRFFPSFYFYTFIFDLGLFRCIEYIFLNFLVYMCEFKIFIEFD